MKSPRSRTIQIVRDVLTSRASTGMLAFLLPVLPAAAASTAGPQPGEVYREYAAHQGGQNWRVTNPKAQGERPRRRLPNAVLRIDLAALEGAVRAEAMLDRWCGHMRTQHPRIRFNGKSWLNVPPPRGLPEGGEPVAYYFQDNPVIAVPLDHLRAGENTFEGTTSHEDPTGWGQWGLYSLILRVYYDPSAMPHPTGRIISPEKGGVFGEDPTVRVEAQAPNGVARIDVLAWYEGVDENGDGVWLDWHGGYFQPTRGAAAELREHVGTLWRAPYELTWDTRWVPDQEPRAVKLIARIQDSLGAWFVTAPVADLTLRREGESVRLYRAADIPPRFGARKGVFKSCRIAIPAGADPDRVMEAGLHLRTWHGWDGHHDPFLVNEWPHPIDGKNHHYDYDVHLVPAEVLRNGDNTFTARSHGEHHTFEVHWPGPALTVRTRLQE